MKTFLVSAFALVLAFGGNAMAQSPSSAPAGGSVDAATQASLNAAYQLRCAAALNPTDANIDAGFASLAPNFVNVDPTGKQTTRDELIPLAREQMRMLKATTCDHSVDSFVQVDASTIQANTHLHVAGTLTQLQGGHAFDLTDAAQDTWKNVGGKWMMTQSRDTHVRVTIDGNVVQELGQ